MTTGPNNDAATDFLPPPIDLGDSKLYALANPYELDGRVATHPRDTRGYAPMNVYLAVEDGAAMLFDAGFSVHQTQLIGQIERCMSHDSVLTLCPIRMAEFGGICNVRPIAEHFNVDALYGLQERSIRWMDFRPEFRPSITDAGGGGRLAAAEVRLARPGDMLRVGSDGREIEVLPAPLRLLPVTWMYDAQTRTLMTADTFTWVWQPDRDGPWIVTGESDPVSNEQMTHHMLANRFWWLPGARTDSIRAEIAEIFDNHDIEVIAPGFGCVLAGRDVVARHYTLLDNVLRHAPSMAAVGVAAGRWPARQQPVRS